MFNKDQEKADKYLSKIRKLRADFKKQDIFKHLLSLGMKENALMYKEIEERMELLNKEIPR